MRANGSNWREEVRVITWPIGSEVLLVSCRSCPCNVRDELEQAKGKHNHEFSDFRNENSIQFNQTQWRALKYLVEGVQLLHAVVVDVVQLVMRMLQETIAGSRAIRNYQIRIVRVVAGERSAVRVLRLRAAQSGAAIVLKNLASSVAVSLTEIVLQCGNMAAISKRHKIIVILRS